MSSENNHINEEHRLDDDIESFIKSAKPKFAKSKEAVWQELEAQMNEVPAKEETKVIQLNWFRYAAAASVAVLLCSGLFARFYTENVVSPRGMHASVELPDGSSVELNAGSEISFHPYWWSMQREVKFEGEGFFEVEKGSRFAVVSNNGTTEVLGTSFNVNSRNSGYSVYCKTGKVEVSNNNGNVVLEPTEMATSDSDGALLKTAVTNEAEQIGWVQNQLVFNSTELKKVLSEIEMQFDVTISISDAELSNEKFTGSFAKTNNVKQTLEIIGSSMNFTFEQTAIGTYSVKKDKP